MLSLHLHECFGLWELGLGLGALGELGAAEEQGVAGLWAVCWVRRLDACLVCRWELLWGWSALVFWNEGTGVACALRMWVELAAAAAVWPHRKPVGPSSVAAIAAAAAAAGLLHALAELAAAAAAAAAEGWPFPLGWAAAAAAVAAGVPLALAGPAAAVAAAAGSGACSHLCKLGQ